MSVPLPTLATLCILGCLVIVAPTPIRSTPGMLYVAALVTAAVLTIGPLLF